MKTQESKLVASMQFAMATSDLGNQKLLFALDQMGEKGFDWLSQKFDRVERQKYNLQLMNVPKAGDMVFLECRFRVIQKKQGVLSITSFIKLGEKTKKAGMATYTLKFGNAKLLLHGPSSSATT